jgi:hypothetical protein
MDPFDRFLQERTYLKGVSPETLRYYRWVRRAFLPILANPTKAGMLGMHPKAVGGRNFCDERKHVPPGTESLHPLDA